ncbi:unnamed protein product [Trichobilharzia regenti]|nr:unnamed protein product [Trichobilharzia regenti]
MSECDPQKETGALITTPGEQEEHVFIIEAPPEIAMRVAHHLATRAQEITQSKIVAGERRRGSTSSQPCGNENGVNITNGSSGNLGPSLTPGGSNNFVPNSCSSISGILSLASPGNSNTLGSQMQTNTITSAGLFSGTNTPGSRVLLARGRISVPQEMVGKIIGTQGSIITTIQKDTGTEIKSPPKEAARGPNATSEFEISAYQGLGLSSNQAAECRVQQAKQLIGHLVMRQLERRASEEVEETSGSSNMSSEEQRGNGSSAPTMQNVCNSTSKTNGSGCGGWMWPDVAQMDSQEAREVLDRILAESKNKTRRAKELAVVSSGPSSTSSCSVSALNATGSLLNPNSCTGSQSLTGDNQHSNHFQSHMLNGTYFDGVQTNGCDDVNSGEASVSKVNSNSHCSLNESRLLSATFSPNNGHFNHRASTTSSDGVSNGFQACVPRTLQNFDLSAPNDFLIHLNRAPGSNLVSDIWNSAVPSFTSVQTESSTRLHGYVGSNSALNNLMTSSSNHNSNVLASNPNRILNSRALDSAFDTAMFNFNESRQEADGNVSPTILLHNRLQQQQNEQDLHQPLTRRHSDWLVPSSHLLTEITADSGDSASSPRNHLVANDSESGTQSYSVNSFNFIHALDQLCLNSSCDKDPVVSSTNSLCTTINNNMTACPPGFESHDPNDNESVFTLKSKESLVSSNKLWSSSNPNKTHGSTNGNHSNGNKNVHLIPTLPSSCSESLMGSRLFSNTSVLQRLFSNPGSQTSNVVSTDNDITISSRINSSIWSQANNDHIPNGCSSNSIDDSFGFSYFESGLGENHHQCNQNDVSQSVAYFSENLSEYTTSSSNNNNNGTENGTINGSNQSARCGAIGEGRRRRRPSPNLLSSDSDTMSLSVSSALASITEVA